MWGYIFCGIIVTYCCGFCIVVAYVSYKEHREEQRQIQIEYNQLSNRDFELEIYSEQKYDNKH
uniref:Uncharacterized protein n=1 Tax=viral metagenome TaxID=1070528 RepID=A0A6C0C3G5_9ZZZZ